MRSTFSIIIPVKLVRVFIGFCLVLVLAAGQGASAQTRPFKGVVWQEPEDFTRAAEDLREMRRLGVEAVRTDLISNPRLLTLADTLGLQFFQELPISSIPADRLRDSLEGAVQVLETALARARTHPSARHFGLARGVDTSDPAACAYFEHLTERAREHAPAGTQFYYVTSFTADDQCAGTVDFVLLDVLNARDPLAKLARWRAAREGGAPPAGIGAIGTWVLDAPAAGVRTGHSREAQARYLETHLQELLADTSAAPVAVFVYRWRDVNTALPSPAHDLDRAYVRPYGLFSIEGVRRPASDVVGGLYTGRQTVFAFPRGEEPAPTFSWIILLGWGVLILLGVYYALSPRFRQMVPRYFRARGFYREAVREGRDILFITSAVLLVVVAVSVGIILSVLLRTVRAQEPFVLLVQWLPESMQETLVSLLGQPALLVLLVSSFYAFGLVVWSVLLSLFSRRRFLLVPGQAVMLIVWPRWTALVLMIAAMVVSTLPPEEALSGALILLGCWVLLGLYSFFRTLYDYTLITHVPVYLTVLAGLLHPVVLLLVFGLFLALEHRSEYVYLWHLIVRS